MSRLAAECGAINLGQGFPDFPVDPALIEHVHEGMRKGYNQYAPMPGLYPLRERLCEKAEKLHGHSYDVESEVTICAGATQAIFTAVQALVHEGDEVIIVDPAYDCYAPAVVLAGGVPVHVQLDSDLGFDVTAISSAVNDRTRMLIINSPHNPGGRVITKEQMLALQELLRGTDIVLLSDEVYEHLIYDGVQHESVIRYPELRDRAVVVFSFGKVFHATGWKMGYAFAPKSLMEEFRKVHQYNVFSANSAVQYGLAEYLTNEDRYLGLPAFFQAKRDLFLSGIAQTPFNALPCEGSYFLVADYSAISEMPDTDFAVWFTKHYGVATIPMSPFYESADPDQRMVRFCFAKKDDTLEQALTKLHHLS